MPSVALFSLAKWTRVDLCLFATPFCQALRVLVLTALTLVEIKFARKSTHVFPRLVTQPKLSGVHSLNIIATYEPLKHRICLSLNVFPFATCVYLRGNLRVRLVTTRRFLCKFKLRQLATSGESVWPGHYVKQEIWSVHNK